MNHKICSADLVERRKTAAQLVHDIGMECLNRFRTDLRVVQKGLGDVVTETDISMEKQIRRRLSEAWPSDGVLGEELGGAVQNGWVWIIDPIDGTSNFSRGIAHWCVSIGALFDGVPVVGAVFDPIHDELFVAAHSQGATLNDLPLRRVDRMEISSAIVGVGLTEKADVKATLDGLKKLVELGVSVRAQGAGALTLCHVACGRLDGFVEDHIHLWDVCAAAVVLAQAGCSFRSTIDISQPSKGFAVSACVKDISDQLMSVFEFSAEPKPFG